MSVTAIIKDATIITVKDIVDELGNKPKFLYGTVVADEQQRFNAGNWFLSSMILDIFEDKVKTRNSIYRVDENPDFMELSIEEFLYVKQGHEPKLAKRFANDNPDICTTKNTIGNQPTEQ